MVDSLLSDVSRPWVIENMTSSHSFYQGGICLEIPYFSSYLRLKTSFSGSPGLHMWKSSDLVDWYHLSWLIKYYTSSEHSYGIPDLWCKLLHHKLHCFRSNWYGHIQIRRLGHWIHCLGHLHVHRNDHLTNFGNWFHVGCINPKKIFLLLQGRPIQSMSGTCIISSS